MLTESNFWLTTVQPLQIDETPLPEKADVIVIGAGYSGLSAARTLAKSGASVAVLEAETLGWGASSRNGGMVLTGLKLGVATLIRRYGLERARRLFSLSLAALEAVEQLVKEEGISCSFSRCGHLEAAWKPGHFREFQHAAEIMERDFHHPVRLLPRDELHKELGSDLYHGGLLDEVSGSLNPGQYVMGLGAAAARAGAQVHQHTRVQSVEQLRGGFRVRTKRGSLRADMLFAGTSGYTDGALPSLRRRVIPVGSFIIATAPLPDELARQLIPNRRMVFDSKNYLYYFRLTPDQRMLFGGRAAFMPETRDSIRRSAEILRSGMLEVFPQLREVPIDYAWGGTLDFGLDLMPHTGQIDGVFHAIGYAGHGVAFASYLGQIVAHQMLGAAVENPLQDLPFQALPIYEGWPWFLPLAGAYYKILDWTT